MLTIVATPIGNLKDITLRSLEALKNCDGIICEDTRRSAILLNNYSIKKPFLILNDFNESKLVETIISRLERQENLCLISDAGTPLVSDPGFKLVRECLKKNILVDSLPGPSAVITALTLSGLPTDRFMFLGYPPEKSGHRLNFYRQINEFSKIGKLTFIIFVAPFKLKKTLGEMKENLGDVSLTLAKELTKIYQNISAKNISEWLIEFNSHEPKGEYVMLFNLGGN